MSKYLRWRNDGRRFAVGYQTTISGITFRVEQGRKSEDDRVLEWLTDRGWRPIDMAVGFLLVDFFYENEHELYPPPLEGGEYYRRFEEKAVQKGWQAALAQLQAEKANARARRSA